MRFKEFKITEDDSLSTTAAKTVGVIGAGATATHIAGKYSILPLEIVKRAWGRVPEKLGKAILSNWGIGGNGQLVYDVLLFTVFPSMREQIFKHWRELNWVEMALDYFTLRGSWWTIAAAMIAQLASMLYDEIFEDGGIKSGVAYEHPNYPGTYVSNLIGDDPTVKGSLYALALKGEYERGIIGIRVKAIHERLLAEIKSDAVSGKEAAQNMRNALTGMDTPNNPDPRKHPEKYPQ